MASLSDVQISMPSDRQVPEKEYFDYSQRAQWLRAAVLGATDGLVSVASLMMGVGAVKNDVAVMILTGFAGLVAAQMKRDKRMLDNEKNDDESEKEQLPNPFQAALASALAFSLGALVPLLAAAFIGDHKVRLMVVIAAVTFALLVFGGVGAVLGKTPALKSCARLLIGGWIAMAITFGLTKLIGSSGL
ncbi:hypothetical protein ACET3Z_001451 [Daucus carota]